MKGFRVFVVPVLGLLGCGDDDGNEGEAEAEGEGELCEDSCDTSDDGDCDDGGPDSKYDVCEFGTDCADCGPRSGGGESEAEGECDATAVCQDAVDVWCKCCYDPEGAADCTSPAGLCELALAGDESGSDCAFLSQSECGEFDCLAF